MLKSNANDYSYIEDANIYKIIITLTLYEHFSIWLLPAKLVLAQQHQHHSDDSLVSRLIFYFVTRANPEWKFSSLMLEGSAVWPWNVLACLGDSTSSQHATHGRINIIQVLSHNLCNNFKVSIIYKILIIYFIWYECTYKLARIFPSNASYLLYSPLNNQLVGNIFKLEYGYFSILLLASW